MNILITAGPTWVKIDEVRILTSIFTGKTGMYIARAFHQKGHRVTLLGNLRREMDRGVRVIPFTYFEDFKKKICRELMQGRYDVIIHSAAVSDYILRKPFSGKIPSGKIGLEVSLKPAEKIIRLIRRLTKKAIIIQFKLEIKRKGLLDKAYKSLVENKSDFVVANALEDLRRGYQAFILDKNRKMIRVSSKKMLTKALVSLISER
ncbi:MAG: phosphopantothenoylcysteine decarboxylase [Candidatus Omnitrophota bacterium]